MRGGGSATIEESEGAIPIGPKVAARSRRAKLLEYGRNRNRVCPGKVELVDCDFLVVGPRRTLRVLLPAPRGNAYYDEAMRNERPETIDESVASRWASRPHPSGDCRCSFTRSKNRSGADDGVAVDLVTGPTTAGRNAAEEKRDGGISTSPWGPAVTEQVSSIACGDDEKIGKNKIVKDSEACVERLLRDAMSDAIKFFNDPGEALTKVGGECSCGSVRSEEHPSTADPPDPEASPEIANGAHPSPTDSLENNPDGSPTDSRLRHRRRDPRLLCEQGCVNHGFAGSENEPDSLEDQRENLDLTDSGINSVETMEFGSGTPMAEPSLEESLMEIMDAKFGRGPSKLERDDDVSRAPDPSIPDRGQRTASLNGEIEKSAPDEKSSGGPATTAAAVGDSLESEEADVRLNFDKLRLEISEAKGSTSNGGETRNFIEALRRKFTWKFSIGCENRREGKSKSVRSNDDDDEAATSSGSGVALRPKNRKVWREIGDRSGATPTDLDRGDDARFRKHRKPVVIFLHGFGSSAEIFENQLEYFSNRGYTCIAPELLGHGMSSAPDRSRDYRFDKLLGDLETVLRHYALESGRECVIVAHNYGCSFATALASKYDNNVHQMVLISGGGPTPLAPPSTEGPGRCCLRATLAPLLMCGLRRNILYSARGRQHPYCGTEPLPQRPSHMKYVLDGMIWPEGDYVFHRRISTPTLLIHGLRDDKVSLVQECQMERTIIKAFLDAIPTAGHAPMIDCPEQVNHMIHCFMELWKRKKR